MLFNEDGSLFWLRSRRIHSIQLCGLDGFLPVAQVGVMLKRGASGLGKLALTGEEIRSTDTYGVPRFRGSAVGR